MGAKFPQKPPKGVTKLPPPNFPPPPIKRGTEEIVGILFSREAAEEVIKTVKFPSGRLEVRPYGRAFALVLS